MASIHRFRCFGAISSRCVLSFRKLACTRSVTNAPASARGFSSMDGKPLKSDEICATLRHAGITFYTGVPDSLLKDFCAYVTDNVAAKDHVIAANEGGAVALAAGHYLGSGNPAVVYLQNSGLGNTINPLLSLADPGVYAIPMLVIVGWRGKPGEKDEPQHMVTGRVQNDLLEAVGLPYEVLPPSQVEANATIDRACKYMREKKGPFVLVVPKGTFAKYQSTQALSEQDTDSLPLNRKMAIGEIVSYFRRSDSSAVFVGTTGFLSRELYEMRDESGEGHGRDFLCVGNMGHASAIAQGIALSQPSRTVVCLDGDGAALMHMGNMAVAASDASRPNLVHVIVNNGVHESVGAQPTVGFCVDFCTIARGCGYASVASATSAADIQKAFQEVSQTATTRAGPAFIEVRVRTGTSDTLGRPKTTPEENKDAFIKYLQQK
eukprot:gnl/MRDRNA2_/MRDRNA2_117645_c0_seq1.p1 gnl/MRDRNA2_/MRDRNA2_117645_c0~~gnl/MRDRNA2_/MRDRNA2_117645_c0_seq1.p1  ORF type:complete len:448 (-),score=74.47 gnl/MRDRNA2_/MRDRNA2_117645_c0_seq1:175-1479(-)